MRKGIIYMATNKVSGKSYIGQTLQKLSNRKSQHYHNIKRSKGKNNHFANALKKYRKKDWEWKVICKNVPLNFLNNYEVWCIGYYDTYHNGYNSTTGGGNGKEIDPKVVAKVAAHNKGNKYWLGRHHTEESKKKMSLAHKGKKIKKSSIEKMMKTKEKNGTLHVRRPHTSATKRKISEANKGKKLPESQIEKMRMRVRGDKNPFFGKTHSKESMLKAIKSKGCKAFRVINKDGEVIGVWQIQTDCAKELGLNNTKISNCLHGSRKSHYGYTFEYIEENE